MIDKKTIVCVIGTRPEAIKMAPVIHALEATEWARCIVIATAQHRDLLDQMLSQLDVRVDHDLDIMTSGQTPSQLLVRMLPRLDELLVKENASAVLAQGDTTTVLATALSAFHNQIRFGHIEAGLRTHDLTQPFPEEGNRQLASRLAHWHFAPTPEAAENLRREDIPKECIYVTGNTGIDTLVSTVSKLRPAISTNRQMILITAHRRENFGMPMHNIFLAMIQITRLHSNIEIVYPVHPNPNVRDLAYTTLGGHSRIHLLQPQDYFEFVDLMRRATLILTDSGGIQEEAPALGKPVLVLREQTERPEGVNAGVSKLVGTSTDAIVENVSRLLKDNRAYTEMAQGSSPYGDGKAAIRIAEILKASMTKTDS